MRIVLDIEGSETLSRSFRFDDFTFTGDAETDSTLEMDMVDSVLYYELLDNVVSLDLGLNVKFVDGSVELRGTTEEAGTSVITSERVDFTAPLPLLYGAASVDLPLAGLSAQAEISGLTYGGHKAFDALLSAHYTFAFGLGLELGYRTMVIDLDDVEDVSVDVDISGLFAGAYFDF